MILTVSRIEAEKKANPGYRAFFANGFNVTRALVLFGWEVILEIAALRQRRRDVRPRPSRRPLSVHARGDVRRRARPDRLRRAHGYDEGRPAVYATFSSYDEVAHHSGSSERTRLRLCASSTSSSGGSTARGATPPRPYEIVVLSTTGRLRARRSSSGTATASTTSSSAPSNGKRHRDRRRRRAGLDGRPRVGEATGRTRRRRNGRRTTSPARTSSWGSGNLGLVSLMEEPRRLTLEEIDRAPGAPPGASRAPARRLAARSLERRRAGGARCPRTRYLADGRRR